LKSISSKVELHKIEPKKYHAITDLNEKTSEFSLAFSILLAWQDAFRTFDWITAVGDLETTTKEIKYLLALV